MKGVATISAFSLMGLLALVACSGDVPESSLDCAETPKARGCAKVAAPGQAPQPGAQQSMSQPPPPPMPPPVTPDGGSVGLKPDGGMPSVPPPDFACSDLGRCCMQVRDTLERAACLAITYKGSSSSCANAIIAYQVFGGCAHSEFQIPDIFNSDWTPNTSRDCTYLINACNYDPSQCYDAYQCSDGQDVPGSMSGGNDYCASQPDPYCCRHPYEWECAGPVDACAYDPDPYCCRNPGSYGCSGTPSDGCEYSADPYCCRNPYAYGCYEDDWDWGY